jgi:hypothetical protein
MMRWWGPMQYQTKVRAVIWLGSSGSDQISTTHLKIET